MLLMDDTLCHIQEARAILEVEIVGKVTAHASDHDVEALSNKIKNLEDTITLSNASSRILREHFWDFHKTLADMSGNPVLAKLVNVLLRMISAAQMALYIPYTDPHYAVRCHDKILHEIRNRNVEGAREEMYRHLSEIEQIMCQNLVKQLEGEAILKKSAKGGLS